MIKKVKIFDTTLRDGEQAPGVVFSPEQKLHLAKKFDEFGVNFIDVMPIVSKTEQELAKKLVKTDLNADIAASCMLREHDIKLAAECGIEIINLFAPVSDIQLYHQMRISREENLRKAKKYIEIARNYDLRVNFACADATRADKKYLIDFINELGYLVDIFFIADTMGCLTPNQTYEFIREIKNECNCDVGLHVHNDFGLATANTLEGLAAGADCFSGTFTGIGERAGNAPIEEVCIGLKYLYNIDMDVRYDMITNICRLVEKYSGVHTQVHKPIIGTNAFTHESGIHADGVIKKSETYENFDPEFVGQKRRFVFGKHSGRSVVRYVLGDVREEEIVKTLEEVKKIAERERKVLDEEDIINIYKKVRMWDETI